MKIEINQDATIAVIKHDTHSPGLLARRLWEGLYRISGAFGFESFDSFLCDLYTFQRVLADKLPFHKPVTLYWECSDNGLTELTDYYMGNTMADEQYKIEINRDTITISQLK